MIKKINNNLVKNMLLYTFFVIIGGVIFGSIFNLKFLSKFIIPTVLIMIYPMMINLSLSSLKKIKGSIKPLVEALILNFVYAPLFMWILSSIFISDPKIILALMLLSIAPSSSMGLGYIGLAEGHMLSGSIIVAFAFLVSVIVYPFFGHYFAQNIHISVPFWLIFKNLLFVLILPLILGIITREYLEKKHTEETFLKLKPYFSAITLVSLYILIFLIFSSKTNLILKNWQDIFLLLPVAFLFYTVTVLLTLFINKKIIKIEYGHHQSVVFTSVSKNIALTIAILVAIFGEEGQYLSVFPAIMSLFQAPFLILYLKSSRKVKHWFLKNG